MPTPFLTDATFWITVCAARLQEIGARDTLADAEETASGLWDIDLYRMQGPCKAAESFRARSTEATAG